MKCRRCGKGRWPDDFEPREGFQGGRSPICRACEANPKGKYLRRSDDPGYRTCKHCRLMLPVADFSPKQYICRPCRRQRRQIAEMDSYQRDLKQAKDLGLNSVD